MPSPTQSAAIRAKLDHPIIDSDGHTAEFEPAVFDYLRDIGGSQAVERFQKGIIYLTPPYDLATLPLWQQTEQVTTICWD